MYNIIGHRKIFFIISGVICGCSILALIFWGLKPGIDFTGGSLMEIKYSTNKPVNSEIVQQLSPLNLGEINIQTIGQNSFVLRFKEINEDTHQAVLRALGNNAEESKFESIGPIIGGELVRKSQWAIILALMAMFLYIAWAFRKLANFSRQGEYWRYSSGAIVALLHNVLVMCGFFAVWSHFKGVEINANFITAILTVLGYSINDTIVVFDRIRENVLLYGTRSMEETINKSINEIIVRSLNTGMAVILALIAIYLFGGVSLQDFAIAMIIGISVGTYSSIAIASPFLLLFRKSAK
ncbi:MAG: protein translocase subunit SecF [Patescibacteria group bacterium]|nr:protein translocase subunit SecF [Patescibacteria group bacterium]MDD5534515.1 protein translocase subunit SecF [Patescibacteria group bacterium]